MCDFARPLTDGTAPVELTEAEETPPQAKGKTLYLKLPSMDSPEMEHLRRVLYMFEGKSNPVRIRLADSGKLIGTTCDLHDSLVREMQEKLGAENVVVK